MRGLLSVLTCCMLVVVSGEVYGDQLSTYLVDEGVDVLMQTPPEFVRADVEEDGDHDIYDCLTIIYYVGGDVDSISCEDAADVDDDGDIDIYDGLCCIYWLGGACEPAPPCCAIPDSCGPDPTPDDLGCVSYPPCGWPPK